MCETRPTTYLVVEGRTDLLVVRRLFHQVGLLNVRQRESGGKRKILDNLQKYNEAAQYTQWIIVLDLDLDEYCAPDYINRILPSPYSGMTLRIAVHSIESWLMADSGRMARFLQIPAENFPANPDTVTNPKRFLIDLIRQKCRRTQLRRDMLPDEDSSSKVGLEYNFQIANYVQKHWRPEVAACNSDSLARCIRALESLKRRPAQ